MLLKNLVIYIPFPSLPLHESSLQDCLHSLIDRSNPAHNIFETALRGSRLHILPASFQIHFLEGNLEVAHGDSHIDVLQTHTQKLLGISRCSADVEMKNLPICFLYDTPWLPVARRGANPHTLEG